MEQPAVSHQLRLLRALDLVAGDRDGRNIVYRLYDNHVAQLLDEAVYHIVNRRGFDAASFFEKDADYVEALPGRAA